MLFEIYIFKKHKHWETYFNMEQSFLIPSYSLGAEQSEEFHFFIYVK